MDSATTEAASGIVDSVHFSFYTPEEVQRISVKKITKANLLDAKDTPIPDGLYDPALGPINDTDLCKSCGQVSFRCPGHCGHIDFAKPLYNPLLFKALQNLLQITCFYCYKFRLMEKKVKLYIEQLDLIAKGDIAGAKSIARSIEASEIIVSEESAESVTSSVEITESKANSWVSIQHCEALSVLSKFMKERRKKCDNCGRKCPTITSPLFGWFNKGTQASDIRTDYLLDSSVVFSSSDTKNSTVTQLRGESASEMDEELSTPKNRAKESKKLGHLPPEFIKRMASASQKHLLPSEVESILEKLWENEAKLCQLISDIQCKSSSLAGSNKGYAMFFLKALLVPPSKFRPAGANSDRELLEHPQNTLLIKVQQANIELKNCITSNSKYPDILRRWMDLQKSVNVLFDSSKGFAKSDKETNGIRQLLEKKSGILRQKMMGKRVNFACRSVISPDPYLAVNEIGIPPCFALRLTYPERVTPWNANKLRRAVINGADLHPGATHYKDRDRMYKLQASKETRMAISRKLPSSRGVSTQHGMGPESEFEGKVVYRHLQDGDIVLVNRQPSLHKPSMMAHVVRVLKGEKTLRMHYANCSTYNADFDGDEMNVHFPQDEIARSEAMSIVNANKQYIVPTSGDPIRGLIQDHIVSAVLLTKMDTFLTREEYHQLLYTSLVPLTSYSPLKKGGQKVLVACSSDDIQPLPPAIWKPIPLWTGKQVITSILDYITRGRLPFTIEKRGRIQKEYIGDDHSLLVLYVYKNELLHGMIDKAQFGPYGLVHAIHELYGPDVAGTLLSVFSRLFTAFVQMYGFTCGVDDLLLKRSSDMERKRILEKSEIQSEDAHIRFTRMNDAGRDPKKLQREVEKVIRRNGESATALLDRMMSNSLNTLTSEINLTLFPSGLSKPFLKNCLSLMTNTGAKGGLVNMTQISSLLGQQELEGKRVPRMVSGKTLPCFPPWDFSSRAGGFISDRFLTGLRPQEYYFHCMAGRDGLVDTAVKTSRSGYLQRCLIKNLESLKVSYDHTVRDADGSLIQFTYGEDGVDVLKTSYISEFKMLSDNHEVVLQKFNDPGGNRHLSKSNSYVKELPCSLQEKAIEFVSNRKRTHKINKKKFMKLMKLKYLSSLAEPGEPVGVVAAQSVGEPSTQMTLNTFHLAGKGDMNVTLGIPRLQEILMTASKDIRTPLMNCPLHAWKTKEDAERLAATLRRVTVADIVESMEVCSVPFSIQGNQIATIYKLKMNLYPSELYPAFSELTLEDSRRVLTTTFVDAMEVAITKHLDMLRKINEIRVVSSKEENNFEQGFEEDESRKQSTGGESIGRSHGEDEDYEESDEDQASGAKKRKHARDEVEYDDDDEKGSSLPAAGDHDEETQSGFQSEIDQVEADEDYSLGGDCPSSDSDSSTPDSPSGDESTPMAKDKKSSSTVELTPISGGNKEAKSAGKGKKEVKLVVKMKAKKPSSEKVRRTIFVEAKGLKFEVHYIFRDEPRVLLAEIAQKTAKCVYVKQYKNIDKCSLKENKKSTDPFVLQVAGVNFSALWDLEEHLDINQIYSNDIHAMLNTYGVEAARATIIKEVSNVFGLYGIKVNIRHLSLIADFMTFHGGYRPMNRMGIGEFSTSPFGKMTFETATKFIVESALHGETDTLESPSASVCLGQPVKMGTGCFDLMQNLGNNNLRWLTRLKIALDVAKRLAFLHGSARPIIYRDFKTSNILLDVEYNGKFSDFGLAKEGPVGEQTHATTRVMGTCGYAAPEHILTGHLTAKSDVYGFGVVLVELLLGR